MRPLLYTQPSINSSDIAKTFQKVHCAIMKAVLLFLGLAYLAPVFSYPVSDCDNCEHCVGNKCRRCAEGYALDKIYARRFCVGTCEGTNRIKIWDPVLRTYACDSVTTCQASSNCAECLSSGSCKTCGDGFALRLMSNSTFGFSNVCDGTCVDCVEQKSGARVCNTPSASCGDSGASTQQASMLVTTSSTPTSTPEPDTDATDFLDDDY